MIPSGVTVTTSDPALAPANFTIVFASETASSAVVLASGSTLEGVSIDAGGGNPAASALSCTAASGAARPVIRSVDLLGARTRNAAIKPAVGLALGRTAAAGCTATISHTRVLAFATGIAVDTGGADPITISDSSVEDAGGGDAGA